MKRPENHIKEAESFAYVEDTLKEWVLNRLATDYGIDFDIQIFEQGEGTALNFGAQIKSTESSNMDATHYKFKLETRHINYFFKQNRPILLVVYYIPKKIAYWVVIQEYVWDILSKEKPNWSSQKSSTIKLPLKNVLTNKEEIKKAVRRCYSKIFFENLHTLFIDDGLGQYELLENPENVRKYEEKAEYILNNVKLLRAQHFAITGDYETLIEKLNEIYSQNKKDLPHLRSIMGLIEFSNIAVEEENKEVVKLADEGLQIAQQLDKKIEFAILQVFRAQALHLTIVRRITANLIARKSSDIIVEIEINKRIKQLEDILTEISLDVTNAFKILIDSNNYYILASMLTIKLSMATFTIQYLGAIIGKEKFKDEIKSKDILAQYLISFIKEFEDRELELIIRISVASYYYATRGGKEGLKIVEPALEIAKERNNQPRIRKITFMITQFKTRPDLYGDVTQQLEKSSFRSLTESVREHIELLGQDLSDGSDISYALNLGLKDMDPEPYLKYCEKLIIYYAGTSYLGEMFGVQSIGYKLLWCEHSKVTLNYHLDRGFEIHKEHHCDSCKHRKPRLEDWVCTVGWFYNREVPKPIQEFLDKMNQW